SGDTNNVASSGNAILGVTQTTSSESMTLDPTSITVGGSSLVTVSVAGVSPTGTISFTTTGTGQFNSTSCVLHSGTCAVTYNDVLGSLGSVSIAATYSGDANNQATTTPVTSTLTVSQATTSTTVSLDPSSVAVGSPSVITAQVTGGFLLSGTMSFASNQTGAGSFNSTTCTIHNNQCAVQYTPSSVANGFHKVTATYSGDTNNVASSGISTLGVTKFASGTTVSLAQSSVTVGSVDIVTTTVTGYSPTGTASFVSDGTGQFNSTSCVLHSGTCAVTYTPSAVGTGSHKVTATYSGDTNNVASSGNAILGVTQTTSSEIISLNPSSVVVGHASQVSVTINGVSPTGTVSFSAPSGTGTLSSNSCTLNTAQCSVSFTPTQAGSIQITADYSGDTNNQPKSQNANLAVSQATTTTVLSLNPSAIPAGGTTTVTAQVSGYSPSGTVSIGTSSGTLSSNSCTLDNTGKCSVTLTTSTSGQVTVTATYSGETNNRQSSDSAILNVALLQGQKNGIAS